MNKDKEEYNYHAKAQEFIESLNIDDLESKAKKFMEKEKYTKNERSFFKHNVGFAFEFNILMASLKIDCEKQEKSRRLTK